MGTSKSLFWAVCIICICGSRGYTGGFVEASSSRRKERSLELCLNKRSLVAALTRDDDKMPKGKFIKKNEYERIIEIARKEIGVVERTGRNDGERVGQYLAYVGFKEGSSYCSAWVSFVFGQAGYSQPRTAWSPSLFPKQKLVAVPKPGIVFGIYYEALKRIGHCGIIESLRNDWTTTLEANTNFSGDREGQGVWRRIRHNRTIHAYSDWVD